METANGQLTEKFNIEKVRAMNTWCLAVRIRRKLLAYKVNCFINYTLGNSILQFEKNCAVKNLHTALIKRKYKKCRICIFNFEIRVKALQLAYKEIFYVSK